MLCVFRGSAGPKSLIRTAWRPARSAFAQKGKESMPRHSFVQQTKLRDLHGRIDYISSPKRQEHLYGVYSTAEPEFWRLLSRQNQYDFMRSGSSGSCIEARELIISLPESFQNFDRELLLRLFTEKFRQTYDVQCIAALHHNKAMTNYHVHLIFSERKLLEKKEVKLASRNMFYDERGKHVRTRKEILDAAGNIRPGCRIVPKGEPCEMSYFAGKEAIFKRKMFLADVKTMYTDLINSLTEDEKDRLQVFDKAGPYLPTKKIGKHNPREKEIRADNEARQEWNRTVDEALVRGMPEEEVVSRKRELLIVPVGEAIRKEGFHAECFRAVVLAAVNTLLNQVRGAVAKKEEIPKVDFRKFNEMVAVRKKLYRINGSIERIERQILKKQEKLKSLHGLRSVFQMKLQKSLMNEIADLLEEHRQQQDLLDSTVTRAGYWSVASFLKAYEKAKQAVREYSEYRKQKSKVEDIYGDARRESVLKKLAEYEQEGKKDNRGRNRDVLKKTDLGR